MHPIFIAPAAIVICLLALGVLARRFLHYTPQHSWEQPVKNHIIAPLVSDDTEQMSVLDRRLYMESQQSLTETAEQEFLIDSAPSMQEILIDFAEVQAFLNSGYLASTPWVRAAA